MKVIKSIKLIPITIIFIIYIVSMIGLFVWTVYTSDGKWTYNKIGELYFVDKDGFTVKDKEVKYQNQYFYVDKYGGKIIDNYFFKDIIK